MQIFLLHNWGQNKSRQQLLLKATVLNVWHNSVIFVNVMDAVINNSSQKLGGSNAYPDPAPKIVGGFGLRKAHTTYAPDPIYYVKF